LSGAADYDGAQTIGPAKGWLIVSGGGGLTREQRERFVALAGGRDANFVVIPTALQDNEIDPVRIQRDFIQEFNARHVTVLHTRDRVRADSDGFVEPLRHASGVRILGGRQWRLADAYLGTAVERELKALLARGGVVQGGSAGASIQASFLVRGASGDRRNPNGDSRIVMSRGHERGFGLLENSAIDQHVNTREREKDLDSVISKHPELIGIGIDETAAIIVHGDSFLVMGGPNGNQVAIHDGKKHDGDARYYFLSSGQTFNLRTRTVELSTATESVPRSVPTSTVAPHENSAQENLAQDGKYPLVLKVTAARRFAGQSGTKTSGTGLLTSKADPSSTPQDIVIECDTGVYSRAGYNIYPARIDQPRQLKIAVRELGSDKMGEFTCKY
jgi:cyanophycinase